MNILTKKKKLIKKSIVLLSIVSIMLLSCSKSENIDISQKGYIINLNSNIVHKPSCQTVPKMSIKNKIVSEEPIEEILMKGYAACKDCKPDRDAKYIVNEEINEFEKILHDEFGFGKNYTDKVLRLLSNLYEGINARKNNNYNSNKEYHRLLASTVYQNRLTWSLIAGHYASKEEVIRELNENYKKLKINDKSYFDNMSINNLYDEVIKQHDIKSGNKNDFAHMSATISVYVHESIFKVAASLRAGQFNGIYDLEANCGYIGDICGTNGTKPSMNEDDYAADLDAVNIYNNYIESNEKTLYKIFIDYYQGIMQNKINRASVFLKNISLEKINEYRNIYSIFLLNNNNFKYDKSDTDYINRMNYFDNFVSHLINGDQIFTPYKYYNYTEY
ncbi:MAG: hypothetical protein J6M39_00295 [Lachnospiraceae bacterium]|nr:hypothetical protein [Lachnospiraceae bacterium]